MKTYIVYCEPCGYKKIIKDPQNVGLREHATSEIQGRIPVFNQEKKKTETFDFIKPMPKYKCPNCGRVVTLKKYNVPKEKPIADPTPDANDEQDTVA